MLNKILSNSIPDTPQVGMGVTQLCWSDRHPYTVIEVVSPRMIVVQADIATRTDKNVPSEQQTYSFAPDPTGVVRTLTLRKNGKWVEKGQDMKGADGWLIGHRGAYHDHSF